MIKLAENCHFSILSNSQPLSLFPFCATRLTDAVQWMQMHCLITANSFREYFGTFNDESSVMIADVAVSRYSVHESPAQFVREFYAVFPLIRVTLRLAYEWWQVSQWVTFYAIHIHQFALDFSFAREQAHAVSCKFLLFWLWIISQAFKPYIKNILWWSGRHVNLAIISRECSKLGHDYTAWPEAGV